MPGWWALGQDQDRKGGRLPRMGLNNRRSLSVKQYPSASPNNSGGSDYVPILQKQRFREVRTCACGCGVVSGTVRLESRCAGPKVCVVSLCTGPPWDRVRLLFALQLCLPGDRGQVSHASWALGSSAGMIMPCILILGVPGVTCSCSRNPELWAWHTVRSAHWSLGPTGGLQPGTGAVTKEGSC